MVRTLADGGSKKAVAAKAPRKQLGCGSGGSSNAYGGSPSSSNSNFGLVNHARLWPTPSWQKGINTFFKKSDKPAEEDPMSATSSDASDSCERMEASDVIVTSTSCSGSSSGGGGCSSSNTERIYSDEEDKENIDPSSSPERSTSKMNGRRSDGSDSSPSPKPRRKNGKQKAGPCKKKKRMVLHEDSDYDE